VPTRAEPDNCFGVESGNRDAADDELALVRLAVALPLDDFAGEKDVFEIERLSSSSSSVAWTDTT